MKIGGVTVTSCEEILVFPRPMAEDIVIKAIPADLTMFEELCPKPEMPRKLVKGGMTNDENAPAYIEAVKVWSGRRFDYILLRSLEPSEIEWETINMEKPGTWQRWQTELQDAGFSPTECTRIVNCVLDANSLNEARLKAAREAFILGQGKESAKSSGQSTEPQSTPSTQPANAGE